MPRRGPKTIYPNKQRPSESILLTPFARAVLHARSRQFRASRSDVVETLLRGWSAELAPEQFAYATGDNDE